MATLNNTTVDLIALLYRGEPIAPSIVITIAIFSIPCFIFLLYHILTSRALLHALNNHVIILLLISNGLQTLVNVPIQCSLFYTGTIWPPTTSFCIFDYFIDYYLFTTCFLLLTWASFERHILIFHHQLYNTHAKRLTRHYIPLGLCCLYPFVYYIASLVFNSCRVYYDVTSATCALACDQTSSSIMGLYEQIIHGYTLVLLTLLLDVCLIIRVLRQRRQMGRQLTWNKNRKMVTQLLSVCLLFFITNGGFYLIRLGQLAWDPNFGSDTVNWIYPLSMCLPPLMSYACLPTLPNLKQKLKRLTQCGHRAVVRPLRAAQDPTIGTRTV